LIDVSHQLTVKNRTATKTKPLADAGAKVADTSVEVPKKCEAIITIIADTNAVSFCSVGATSSLRADMIFGKDRLVSRQIRRGTTARIRPCGLGSLCC
jgi:3-hydroxyisobutyrate dehydrogenase-like beta-hydroxyacid dehydrogenase